MYVRLHLSLTHTHTYMQLADREDYSVCRFTKPRAPLTTIGHSARLATLRAAATNASAPDAAPPAAAGGVDKDGVIANMPHRQVSVDSVGVTGCQIVHLPSPEQAAEAAHNDAKVAEAWSAARGGGVSGRRAGRGGRRGGGRGRGRGGASLITRTVGQAASFFPTYQAELLVQVHPRRVVSDDILRLVNVIDGQRYINNPVYCPLVTFGHGWEASDHPTPAHSHIVAGIQTKHDGVWNWA